MKAPIFELLSLKWRGIACQWWRLWDAQGGMGHGLRRLPQGRLAAVAAERAAAAARVADLFHSLADVYPLGMMRRARA